MPRHEFQSLAKEHHAGQKLRKTSRWDQSPPCSWHKAFSFPRGSIVVCDKGYVDYGWYQALSAAGVYFVRRQKTRGVMRVLQMNVFAKRDLLERAGAPPPEPDRAIELGLGQ